MNLKQQDRRITHIIDELSMGGAQVYLYRLVKALRKKNIDQFVICLFEEAEFVEKLRQTGVSVACLDLAEDVRRRAYLRCLRQLKSQIQATNCDTVLTHLTWSRLLGAWACRGSGIGRKACFAVEHGDIYLTGRKWQIANFLTQFHCKKIIAVSGAMKQWLIENYNLWDSKIAVLHNSIDTENFVSSKPDFSRADLNLSQGAFVFCTIGMLGKGVNKRVDISIEALAIARRETTSDLQLIVCGEGDLKSDLIQLASARGLSQKVHFLGKRNDIPDILNLVNAFCHTAPFEPFGLVGLEAMWMKTPVIVPASGGIQEVVEHQVTGLKYPPLEPKALATQMLELVNSPALCAELAARARTLVENRYTMECYVNELLKIFDDA